MKISEIARDISIGAVLLALITVVYAGETKWQLSANPTCSASYDICGIHVCETNSMSNDDTMNWMAAGATDGKTIMINTNYPSFFKGFALNHEMCHVHQYQKNENVGDELECWIAGFTAYRC